MHMKANRKKWLLLAAGLAVALYLVYRFRTLLNLANFSAANLWATVRGINPGLLGLALLLIYVCYAVRSLRWQALQNNLGPSRFVDIFLVTLAGFAAVNILSRAGEPIRPLLLARKAKHPVADIFGIWALERLIDTASFAIILAIGLMAYHPRAGVAEMTATIAAAKVGGGILGAAVAGVIVFLAYLRLHGTSMLEAKMARWADAAGWRASAARIILGFVRGIQTIKSGGDLLKTVFYSAVHWFLVLVVYVLVCKSFGGELAQLGFSDCTMLLGLTLVGSIIQLPAVGGGFQTAAFVVFTKLFGISAEPATAAALILWLVAFVACSIVGVPVLIREGVSLGQLKEMAEHEKEELNEIAAHGHSETSGKGETTR
jgi:uncharacterized protein (TIRG00374 family)